MSNTQTTKPKKSVKTADKTATKQQKQRVVGRPFKKGQSGNPNGRPKGTGLSITSLVKAELEKCPEGKNKKTYADLVVKRILSKAIKDGDTKMIEKIWAYMDGLPKQIIDADVNLNITQILDELEKDEPNSE